MQFVIDHFIEKKGEYIEEVFRFPKTTRYDDILSSVVNRSVYYNQGEFIDFSEHSGFKRFVILYNNAEFSFRHRQIIIEFVINMGKKKCNTCSNYREKIGKPFCRIKETEVKKLSWRNCKYYEAKLNFIGVKVVKIS